MTPGANRVVTDHLTSFKLIGVSLKSCSKKLTGHCASNMTEVITQKVFQAKIQSNPHMLYQFLMPFKEDVFNSLIFWSPHRSVERKK